MNQTIKMTPVYSRLAEPITGPQKDQTIKMYTDWFLKHSSCHFLKLKGSVSWCFNKILLSLQFSDPANILE
jgi:hypothetical protein